MISHNRRQPTVQQTRRVTKRRAGAALIVWFAWVGIGVLRTDWPPDGRSS